MKVGTTIARVATLMAILAAGSGFSSLVWSTPRALIRVGVLHSRTGTMAVSERAVLEATLLAIEELNEAGGVLGRRIEPVVADGRSDEGRFAAEAERLIAEEGVAAIFGCWTSASRKAVREVVERHDHLLFYPVQYEGLEQSPNIIYVGATPNQQILPGVKWCFDHLGPRMFLVGSDYVFPRTANRIIRDQVTALGGEIVGEAYLPLGSRDVEGPVGAIVRAHPDVILNTVNGDSNLSLFGALRAAGVTPASIPTMSFSLAEQEVEALDPARMAGDYATWSYFQSLAGPANAEFVGRFRRRFGAGRVIDDPMEAACIAVRLWARAVEKAGGTAPEMVRNAVAEQGCEVPEGVVYVDEESRHTWRPMRVGRVRRDGQFDVVWDSRYAIRPVPYPRHRTKDEWDAFLGALYGGWGRRWANETR